jgi:mRNA interferase MazF
MVKRGDILWANCELPFGRRPVCVVTRDAAIPVLNGITCAPLTRTIRGIRSEVPIGADDGLDEECAINCDNLLTISRDLLDREPVGTLSTEKRALLDQALRYALGITY